MDSNSAAPAGWYEFDDGRVMYWDGQFWLDTPPDSPVSSPQVAPNVSPYTEQGHATPNFQPSSNLTSQTQNNQAAAGWYEFDDGQKLYFDGTSWQLPTDRPSPMPTASSAHTSSHSGIKEQILALPPYAPWVMLAVAFFGPALASIIGEMLVVMGLLAFAVSLCFAAAAAVYFNATARKHDIIPAAGSNTPYDPTKGLTKDVPAQIGAVLSFLIILQNVLFFVFAAVGWLG